FSTQENAATFYPITGIGVGDTVQNAFAHNPANIRNYDVSTPLLYMIDGRLTWVAIFTKSNGSGASFQAVGLLDATNLNGNAVQMAGTLTQVLDNYQQYLATATIHGPGVSPQGKSI